jgi:hypothetical protein
MVSHAASRNAEAMRCFSASMGRRASAAGMAGVC